MPRNKFEPPYSVFAGYYDRVADPLRAPNLAAREKILLPHLRRQSRRPGLESRLSICDLCCGTGTTALEFARRGLRVYAVDGSRDMLAVARAKFAKAGANVRTYHADMRFFRLPEPVDFITCEFDAINHLKHKRELESVARAVARALRPGGKFFFDANTRRCFQKLWVMNWIQQRPGFFMAACGGYDRRRDKGWTEFNWFVPAGKARRVKAKSRVRPARPPLLRHYTEHYEEVAWSKDEIRTALSRAGLRVRGCWDLVKFAGGAPWAISGCRFFWLAQKVK